MSTRDAIHKWIRAEPDYPYECRTCGERFDVEYYVCPECGGFSVESP